MEPTGKLRGVFCPESFHHGDPLARPRRAVLEGHADRVELFFEPADPHAEEEASA